MANRMYHTFTGWHEEDENKSGTHVLMTNQEYDSLKYKIKQAEQETQSVKREIKNISEDTKEIIAKKEKENDNLIAQYEQRIMDANFENQYLDHLNENLLRICKERSNKDRNLQPKKKHTGYLVIQSQEKDKKYKSGKFLKSCVAWETVIQTPYTIEFEEEQARKQINKELLTNDNRYGCILIEKIGIIMCEEKPISTLMADNAYYEYNIMFQKKLRANYRSGYWEIICFHSLPIKSVPKDMK